jgi:hypothetical protein
MIGRAINRIPFLPGLEVILQPMSKIEAWPFSYTVRPATRAIPFSLVRTSFEDNMKGNKQAVDDYGFGT